MHVQRKELQDTINCTVAVPEPTEHAQSKHALKTHGKQSSVPYYSVSSALPLRQATQQNDQNTAQCL
jgi:hypothetical protein